MSVLQACAPATEQERPAPTGHYEGTLTYRGAELPVVINLYQDSASRAVQVQLRTPLVPVYGRWFPQVTYHELTLTAQLPGGSRLQLREEPNFLTGAVWLHDTLRAELVAVRRGAADLPAYAVAPRAAGGAAPAGLRYQPLDTVRRRPAILLWSTASSLGAAYGWADWLATQGYAVAVASPTAQPDSAAAQQLIAALAQLQADGAAAVDSTRLGVWAVADGGLAAVQAVVAKPAAPIRYLIIQATSFAPTDRAWLRQLGRRPVPVLGLYGGADTTINVAESSQQLRNAVGRRRSSGVKVYSQAGQGLLLTRPEKTDSLGGWPRLPADLAPSLQQWLERVR